MEEQEEAAPVSLGSGLSSVPGWDFGHRFFEWAPGG